MKTIIPGDCNTVYFRLALFLIPAKADLIPKSNLTRLWKQNSAVKTIFPKNSNTVDFRLVFFNTCESKFMT